MAPADPTAVVGRRIVAAIIDLVIGVVIFSAVFLAMADSGPSELIACGDVQDLGESPVICYDLGSDIYATEGGDSLLVIGVGFAAGIANHVLLQGATGASIGKMLLGLRVINEQTRGLAGMGKCLVRWIVGLLDVSCCFLIGLILVATTDRHRRLGDMAAKTLVVGKGSVGVVPPSAYGTPFGGAPYQAAPTFGSPVPPAAPQQWQPPQPQQQWQPPQQQQQQWAPPAAPAPAPAPQPAPQPQPQAQPAAADGPQWDAARNTYIQWDATLSQWMQWDDAAKQWRPIS